MNRLKIIICSFLVLFLIALVSIKAITDEVIPLDAFILSETSLFPLDGYRYKTNEILAFSVNNHVYFVPKGFETDLASIPRWYWSIISPMRSDLIESSIIHDYLYTCRTKFTRKQVDSVLFHLLIGEGVHEYTAGKMYFAVRLFGGKHFQDLDCENIYHDERITKENPGA